MQSSISNFTDEQKIGERTEEILTQNLEKPRCLITNFDNEWAVHHTHVVHRRMRSDLLSRLEHAWGMPWKTLNLDTRYNVFGVNVDLSVFFRRGWWLLLPERRIVQAYLNNRDTPFLDIVNEKSYNYTLVGSSRMSTVVISRYTPSPIPNQKVSADNYRHFCYPFQDLTPMTTHVHPRFVICHAGRLLSKTLNFLSYATPENELHRSLMLDIVRLYLKWMQRVPPQSPFYTGTVAEEDKDGDNDSNATPPHRLIRLTRADIERAQRPRRARADDRNRSDDSSEGDDGEYKNSSDEDDSEDTPPRRMNRAQVERYEQRRRQVEMYHAREDENQVAEDDVDNTDARRARRVMFEPEAEVQSTRQRDVGEGTSASRKQESRDQRVSKRKRSASPIQGHAEPENGDEYNDRMET
ncbi:hypothetical protein GALMADRAFT_256579 [Galerina marginata CBS 339.88]|uniref:HNH nuclease domain-containing protein n=1 Tax=Galerina marginata (strain CBS 339.88) TaxID=685588 RepID=A0A067SM02_GALM3|nr:hypothetical protein GALMADRAFT_256579 [Galerina marginata CBS 339.88]